MARARRLAASGVSISAGMREIYSEPRAGRIFRAQPRPPEVAQGLRWSEVIRQFRMPRVLVSLAQLGVPVRHVGQRQERKPLLVERPRARWTAEERGPARPDRMAQELHARLVRRAAALLQVARDAGTDHVLPAGDAAPAARNDVIEVQLGAGRLAPAVLAGVAVARVDVQAAEADAGARQVVVRLKKNHPWHANALTRGPDRLFVDRGGQLRPAFEVERLVLLVHRLGCAAVEEDQGPAHGCDVHGLVETIQDQDARR